MLKFSTLAWLLVDSYCYASEGSGGKSVGSSSRSGSRLLSAKGGKNDDDGSNEMAEGCPPEACTQHGCCVDSLCRPFGAALCVGKSSKFRISQNLQDPHNQKWYGSDLSLWNNQDLPAEYGMSMDDGHHDEQPPPPPYLAIALGDLNQDGYIDGLVGLFNGTVQFFRGGVNGSLELDSSGAFALDSVGHGGFAKPAIGDINGDGVLDVAIGTGDGSILFYKVETDGTDGSLLDLTNTSADPFMGISVGAHAAPTIGDITFDNISDVLIGNSIGEIVVFSGNTDGKLERMTGEDSDPFDSLTFGTFTSPVLGDLDGDGTLDLVLGRASDELIFFRGFDSGGFDIETSANPFSGVTIDSAEGYLTPAIADLDGDGLLDVVVTSKNAACTLFKAQISTDFESWDGAYINPVEYANVTGNVPHDVTPAYTAPSIGDVDGDGVLDVAVGFVHFETGTTTAYSNGVVFLKGVGTPIFMDRKEEEENPFKEIGIAGSVSAQNVSRVVLGDIDGDGITDAIVTSIYGEYAYYRGDKDRFTLVEGSAGQIFYSAQGQPLDSLGYFPVMAVGDLNGDGIIDALVSSDYSEFGVLLSEDFDRAMSQGEMVHSSLMYFEGQGNAQFRSVENSALAQLILAQAASNQHGPGRRLQPGMEDNYQWRTPAIGDINADGLNDVLIGSGYGTIDVYHAKDTSTGRTFVKQDSISISEKTGASIAVGDVNGDGTPDLVVGDKSGNLGFYTRGSQCGLGCSSHGRCNKYTGSCSCLRQYDGDACELCYEGYYEGKNDYGQVRCIACPGIVKTTPAGVTTETGSICNERGTCEDQVHARENGKWLAKGSGACTCTSPYFLGADCHGGSCPAGWEKIYNKGIQTCDMCHDDYEKPLAGDSDSCTRCTGGYTTFGDEGQADCRPFWPIVLVGSFFLMFFLGFVVKKSMQLHDWRMEKERRERCLINAAATCEKLRGQLDNQEVAPRFPHFFETPGKLWLATPLNDSLIDFVGMLILNAKQGKHCWKPEEQEMTKKLVHVGAHYMQRYLDLSQKWPDDSLDLIADSSVAEKYEETYASVHSLIQEEENYSSLAAAVKECQACKTDYNDTIDRIPDVGERLITLYETASKLRYGRFDKMMNAIGDEAKVEVNLAPLKGLFRVLEKVCMRPASGVPWDILRGQLVCETMGQVIQVLKLMAANEDVRFLGVNDRFARPAKGWADVGLYVVFVGCDTVVCEVQVVHRKMMLVREQMGAHDSYDNSRLAAELLRMRKSGSKVGAATTVEVVPAANPVLPVNNSKISSSKVAPEPT